MEINYWIYKLCMLRANYSAMIQAILLLEVVDLQFQMQQLMVNFIIEAMMLKIWQ